MNSGNPMRDVVDEHFGGDVVGSDAFEDYRATQEETRGGYLADARPNTYYLGDGGDYVGDVEQVDEDVVDEPAWTQTPQYVEAEPGSGQYFDPDDPAYQQALLEQQQLLDMQAYDEWAAEPITPDSLLTRGDAVVMSQQLSQQLAAEVGPLMADMQHAQFLELSRQERQEQLTEQQVEAFEPASQDFVAGMLAEGGFNPNDRRTFDLAQTVLRGVLETAIIGASAQGASPESIWQGLQDPSIRKQAMLEARTEISKAFAFGGALQRMGR